MEPKYTDHHPGNSETQYGGASNATLDNHPQIGAATFFCPSHPTRAGGDQDTTAEGGKLFLPFTK